MKHKELLLIFRVPIPLKILYIYSAFQEIDEPFFEYLSAAVTEACKERTMRAGGGRLLELFKHSPGPIDTEALISGFSYIYNYVDHEIQRTVGAFDLKQLQSVTLVDPDTVVVTFFSTGEDKLYATLHPRS